MFSVLLSAVGHTGCSAAIRCGLIEAPKVTTWPSLVVTCAPQRFAAASLKPRFNFCAAYSGLCAPQRFAAASFDGSQNNHAGCRADLQEHVQVHSGRSAADATPRPPRPYQCPAPAELLLAGDGWAEEPLCIGVIAEPLLAGAWVEAPVAVAGAGAGARAVAADGGAVGDWDTDSSFLPHAFSASTAASATVYIRVWRVIFIGISCCGRTSARGFVGGVQ